MAISPQLGGSQNPIVHSPLSPMTPTSPVYPDGLIAPIWIRKHAEMIPSVFVLFLRLYESDATASPLEAKDDSVKEDERRHDAELAAEIGLRKKACTERAIKLTVVLLASRKMLGRCSHRVNFAVPFTLSFQMIQHWTQDYHLSDASRLSTPEPLSSFCHRSLQRN